MSNKLVTVLLVLLFPAWAYYNALTGLCEEMSNYVRVVVGCPAPWLVNATPSGPTNEASR